MSERLSIKDKVQQLRANLKLLRTLRLIWTVTRGRVLFTVGMIVLESALFFGSLYIFKLLVNAVAQQPDVPAAARQQEVITYLIIAAAIGVVYMMVRALTGHVAEVQAAKVSTFIDDKIHGCAVSLDLSFFESPAYFDTMKRAMDAGPDRPNAILTNLVDIAKNAMMLLMVGSLLISIHWLLLPLMAVFIIPLLWVRIKSADRMYEWRRNQTHLERKSAYLSSLLTGDTVAKEIRAFGLGSYLRSWHKSIFTDLITQRLRLNRLATTNEMIAGGSVTLGIFACIGFISISAMNGTTSLGDAALFLIAFPQLNNILYSLSGGISVLYANSIYVNNIFELFDLKPSLAEPQTPVPVPTDEKLDLELKDVSFTYPHAKDPALTGVDLHLPAGKIVAVVGLNGAGKTTLIKLLCRLYDPTEGAVTLGGVDVRQFSSAEYRRQLSVVFQDFGRYNVSAADNIRFGDIHRQHSDEDLVTAAEHSGAAAFINKFPQGYNTTMGRVFEEGREVSIGQWQKLAIARAFYSTSRIVILDEATSALDAVSEQRLFQSFRERIGNRAALIISHRLSAVKHADYIYVMGDGQVKQEGTHDELVNTPGEYAKLFLKKPVLK
ncbi:ABC transporter ATP-binding protein [Pseudocnuella soli]|uniref:ABC transporter ATP-binding protein n=1 Tax=Pseudocnuella soli TaxID=2502779 RepID=UPI001052C5A8|nr:ABC transporter ATP-binding protein [Pseudocnuella soli]